MSAGLRFGPFREAELKEVGRRLGAWAAARPDGLFVGLRGDLGAGKSVLARAIARGAGIRDAVPSPTFNLVFRYVTPDGRSIAHLDLFRLNDPDEVWELGWEELSGGDEIALVEWPERAQHLLPADRWDIVLEPASDAAERLMRVGRFGDAPPFPAEHTAVRVRRRQES
jgi:tRNA threonylcarbamoyladenosine biosynthesis protein TsaE